MFFRWKMKDVDNILKILISKATIETFNKPCIESTCRRSRLKTSSHFHEERFTTIEGQKNFWKTIAFKSWDLSQVPKKFDLKHMSEMQSQLENVKIWSKNQFHVYFDSRTKFYICFNSKNQFNSMISCAFYIVV
jgi:hypothetical protein